MENRSFYNEILTEHNMRPEFKHDLPDANIVLEALNGEYVNMIDAGILDPAKVTRSALQNATSVASTLLTTESVVATIKEDVPAMPAGGAGGMGMM